MIKLEELRIGNWIKDDFNFQISQTDFSNPSLWIDDSYPIPINKYWLGRFGFDITNTVGGYERWELENGFRLLDGKHPAFMNFKTVEYVHQLQNLYFAITREELKTIEEIKHEKY